ncbi:MAG TPA: protein kinase [Ktedonobacteraceae bacterium]|nr:protein kinase [Ktedonobacteraceae bacterium]
MSTEPRRRLGKYELQERLGHGGMAEVWKALDTQLQRYVAIKLLHANLQADPEFVKRFQHEAQAIASLRHPNIVQIHDFQVSQPPESDSPIAYMVMAYIEGQTLAHYIANTSARGRIPSPVELVNLFTSISLAVDYAHQKGMIHRDIKPANILLDQHNTARNPMGEPILTDFGLAKLLGVSAGALTATSLGTPRYTSPEQARGYPGNERSDLYALGVILYEMVTGMPPFQGDSPNAVLAQHLNATPASPVLLNPNIPPALTMVIMTALAKDPNARFARAATMTAAIAEALNIPPPESLGQPAYPPDLRSMPTYISSPISQSGIGMTPSSFTPAFAASSPPASPSPVGGIPPVTAASSRPGTALPGEPAPHLATPISWQPPLVPAPGGTVAEEALRGSLSPPAGAIQRPPTPVSPIAPTPAGPSAPPLSPPGRRWKGLYTGLVVLVILALLGSGLGVYFGFFHKNNLPAPVPGGQAFFLSSGQFDTGTAQGIADELQIQLQHIPDPQPGKSYYAWLLGDRHPHAEAQPLEPTPQFTLPLLLGRLPVNNGTVSFFYHGTPQHDNLISVASRMLITEENTNGTPLGLAAPRSAWRYYAEIPQTLYGNPPLSALDHIRHLFYKETRVAVLGLPGGLDAWLFRNTEKVLEWSISARDDYHPQVSDPTVIHNLFLSILDYLDGAPNVQMDVPAGSPLAADPTISRVALLSVVPAQQQLKDVLNNPPGYLDHVALHLNGVVHAPDATPQMSALATQIIEALNNAKTWLMQVRADAQQLVKMDAVQLAQPSTLALLDNMLLYATYAYIGKLDPKTDQVVPGVLQVHYDVAQLATLTLTPNLPQTI